MKKSNKPKCPWCGQAKYPIGKHNKCTVCGKQIDIVTYDKGPSSSKGIVTDDWTKHPSANLGDSDFKDGGKVF